VNRSCDSPIIPYVIGLSTHLSLDCIATHPKYAVSNPKNLRKLTGKKNQYIPIPILNNPIIHMTNLGIYIDLLNSQVAGPNNTTNNSIKLTSNAKLAINCRPV
jgi:hypothetical protein